MMVLGEKRRNIFTGNLTHACVYFGHLCLPVTNHFPSQLCALPLAAVNNAQSPFTAAVYMCVGVGFSTGAWIALLGATSLKKTDSFSPKQSLSARNSSARGEPFPTCVGILAALVL